MGRNIIDISGQNKKIVITNNVLKNSITIDVPETTTISLSETKTNIVEVITKGPKGIQGPPGTLTSHENITVTGSLFVSGGIGGGNITGSNISAVLVSASQGFSGSLEGTASFANNALSASYASSSTSASYAVTASYASSSTSASYAVTASFSLNSSLSVTASHALTASKVKTNLNSTEDLILLTGISNATPLDRDWETDAVTA